MPILYEVMMIEMLWLLTYWNEGPIQKMVTTADIYLPYILYIFVWLQAQPHPQSEPSRYKQLG